MIAILTDIFKIFDKSTKRQFFLILTLMIVSVIMETVSIGLILPVLTLVSQTNVQDSNIFLNLVPNLVNKFEKSDLILYSIIIFSTFYLLKTLFLIFFNWIKNRYIFGWKVELSQKVFKKYLSLPFIFFLKNNSSLMFRNANIEVDHCVDIVSNVLSLILEFLLIIFLISFLLIVDIQITLQVFLILSLIALLLYLSTKTKINKLGISRVFTEKFKVQYLKQGLNGIKDVKIYDKADEFLKKYYDVNKINQKAYEKQLFIQSLPRLILEFTTVFLIGFFALYLNSKSVNLQSFVPILGLFVVASLKIMPSIGKVTTFYQAITFKKPSLEIISNIFNIKENINETISDKKYNETIQFKNLIEAKDIHFKYSDDSDLILKSVSFQIKRGEYIGIIGKSGSGKSTLADIFLGLLSPSKGQILVDKKNINSNLKSWQSIIGYVPQNIYFTDETLENNIAFGIPEKKIDQKKLELALKKAQLISLIDRLPNGVKTMMGEFGHNLSGGERQRIGIARAYYHDPEIIFFDEATSSLDSETEKQIFNIIKTLKGNKTIIVVTHKINNLEDIDKLMIMENGKILIK